MAKIQVQGIGMFTDDTLKKKIIQLANDLQKNAKKGNWNKASENGIRALGRMWGAYQDWARNNESVNEAIKQVYHFKKFSNKDMDELDAMLSRAGIQGTPDFNKNTWTTSGKQTPAVVHKIMKKAGGKKIKESMNESPDADLGKKLKQIQNQIYKLGHQYKSKANVPAMMRSFMLGVQNQLKKDKLTESTQLNERITKPFMVHPTDPSQTERHWVDRFKELADGHGPIIDYGPRESDIYDWNDRRNYKKAIEEYNKYMNKIADGLNKQLNLMNNIWRVWSKISDKYRKIDKS